MKFAFVILHYNVVDETVKCVSSIEKLCDIENYTIVIVDNGSPNESGVILRNLFAEDSKVCVVLNEKNMGFAKGNNIGIDYARNKLASDFVVVLNNDTYLVQNDFCSTILQEWYYSHFAVLGPYIYTFSGKNQNPVAHQICTVSQVDFWIRHHRYGLFRAYLGMDSLWISLKALVKKIIRYKNSANVENESKQNVRQENVKLHGCCFVFSPIFFENFDGFDSRTFMYAEEDILLAKLRKKKLLSVYNPKLKIFHAEKSATKSATKTSRRKKIFVYTEGIKALKILKTVLKE